MLHPTTPLSSTDPPTPEIYTLSLHDALPISRRAPRAAGSSRTRARECPRIRDVDNHVNTANGHSRARVRLDPADRKSTRLNSSHVEISYAVFCLKKKN